MVSRGDELPPMEMTQAMPTILTMLGMAIPEWVDADPPDGLLTAEHLSAHPIRRKAYPELVAKYEGDAPADSDDTGGEDLLRGLGYIN